MTRIDTTSSPLQLQRPLREEQAPIMQENRDGAVANQVSQEISSNSIARSDDPQDREMARALLYQEMPVATGGQNPMIPPPRSQAVQSYNASLPPADLVAELIANLQGFIDILTSIARPGHGPGQEPPADIFGKADMDRSGSLSPEELQSLAENVKRVTGQTLDVSPEAISALDRNNDGELTPDEVDLRKTLSLGSADFNGGKDARPLQHSLDRTWRQAQPQAGIPEIATGTGNTHHNEPIVEQIDRLKELLEIVQNYFGHTGDGSEAAFTKRS